MARATTVRTVAPIIKVTAPRALPVKRKARRRSSSTSYGGSGKDLIGIAIGGAAFGWIEGSDFGRKLPTIPVLGRKGSLAIIGYFIARQTRSKIMWDITKAAVVLSAYELAKDGRITGDDDEMTGDEDDDD